MKALIAIFVAFITTQALADSLQSVLVREGERVDTTYRQEPAYDPYAFEDRSHLDGVPSDSLEGWEIQAPASANVNDEDSRLDPYSRGRSRADQAPQGSQSPAF